MLIADWSMTTATRMALTCQEMKKGLVSAARARKGLRMLARAPGTAHQAQWAGLFQISELHLVTWNGTVSRLAQDIRVMPSVEKIVLRPGLEEYARRASTMLSLKYGRRIVVETRTRVTSTPWQRLSQLCFAAWLKSDEPTYLHYNFQAHLAPPPWSPPAPPIGPGGFDFPLGDSTDEEE